MNLREAIKELQPFADNEHDVYTHNLQNACKLVITALEKHIPKKPKKEGKENLFCPTCDCFLGFESVCMERKFHTPHCSCCGQAIDWSE